MRKNTSRGARESAIASGWTVQGDPSADPASPDSAGADPAIADGTQNAGTQTVEPETAGDHGVDTATAAPAGKDTLTESASDAASDEDADPELIVENGAISAQFSNVALVVLGVLGGLYLLYAWIWLSWAQYYSGVNQEVASASGSLGGVLQQIVFWAAPLAPILWFVAVLALNRGASTLKHAIWLLIGAVILFPFPLLSGGAS